MFKTIIIFLILSGATLLVACDDGASDSEMASSEMASSQTQPQSVDSLGGDFFDESLLLEDAFNIDEEFASVRCVGASEQDLAIQDHPRIIRGQVFAPGASLSHHDPSPSPSLWQRLFLSPAYALPLEGEMPVGTIAVEVVRIDDRARPQHTIIDTTTSRLGHWCLRLPDKIEFGTDIMLRAYTPHAEMRRLLAHPLDRDLSAQSEALIRLLIEQALPITAIPTPNYLNLEVMAFTASDLLQPVQLTELDTTDTAVDKIKQVLLKDERVNTALNRLKNVDRSGK